MNLFSKLLDQAIQLELVILMSPLKIKVTNKIDTRIVQREKTNTNDLNRHWHNSDMFEIGDILLLLR